MVLIMADSAAGTKDKNHEKSGYSPILEETLFIAKAGMPFID